MWCYKCDTMKKIVVAFSLAMAIMVFVWSCRGSNHSGASGASKGDTSTVSSTHASLRENVLTSGEQKALTPDLVIQNLKEGNQHYVNSKLTANDYIGMLHHASGGQYPEAFVLACIDSRVPVEEVFDKAIGDLFVGRVAGNIVDEDILGSMEYGCKVSGARLIVVLGHQSCGAIKAAIEDEKLGNITAMLAKIKPSMAMSKDFPGEHTAENHAFVEDVVRNNIKNTIQSIRLQSPVLKDMADKGEIKIVGAYYSLDTGAVTFLNGN